MLYLWKIDEEWDNDDDDNDDKDDNDW